MKKNLAKALYITLLSTSLVSCQEYLDNNNEGKIPPVEFYKTQEDALKGVVSIYAQMRKWEMVGFNYMIMLEITSDNALKGSAPGDAAFINSYKNFSFTANEGQINDFWKGRYQLINLCNQVISNVPAIPMNDGLKARYIAEAKFCRATFYFDLVRAFGDVPMPTSIENAQAEALKKTAKADVYAQIIKDLEDAAAVLPASTTGSEAGRATKYAAHGYLGKVYLYLKNWDKAIENTQAVISSGKYGLEPDFYQVFRVEKENGMESLFEVQASAVAGSGDLSNCQYSQIQGIRGTGGFGWGFCIPSDNLAKAFDDAGDAIRKKATILYKGETTPDGDLVQGVDVLEGVTIPRYNGKSYCPRSKQVNGVNEGSEQNVRKLRYAEVLLIDAEAKLGKGDVSGAAASLKLVRDRVKLPVISNPTMQDIWNERRLELAMEEDRFFDLVRTGQAAAVLPNFVAGKNEVFPIPQSLIDISQGSIKQNPGY